MNPIPDIVSDPAESKFLLVSFSQLKLSFLHITHRDTQNTSIPFVSIAIHAFSECIQTADLQPKKYIKIKIGSRFGASPFGLRRHKQGSRIKGYNCWKLLTVFSRSVVLTTDNTQQTTYDRRLTTDNRQLTTDSV